MQRFRRAAKLRGADATKNQFPFAPLVIPRDRLPARLSCGNSEKSKRNKWAVPPGGVFPAFSTVLLAAHLVLTLSNNTSRSADDREPMQFAGNMFALKFLNGPTAGVFGQEVQWIVEGGGLPLSPVSGEYTESLDLPSTLDQPHLFGLTRELARDKMSWISSLFLYRPPEIIFSGSERKLLTVALRGLTDEELSDELAISLSGVKKVWCSIYERASQFVDGFIQNSEFEEEQRNGDRGKQKKQRIVAHLREHPEELRPYSRKIMRERKPGLGPG